MFPNPFQRLGAILPLCLLCIPLSGIVYGLLYPPIPLFAEHAPRVGDLIEQSRLGVLCLNSITLAITVIIGALTLGSFFAWTELRLQMRGKILLNIAVLLPLAFPSFLLAGLLRWQLSPGGFIGGYLGLPLYSGFFAAALTLIVSCTPYAHLIIGAALARMNQAEEEVAKTLGMHTLQLCLHVRWPMLKSSITYAAILISLHVLADFGAVAITDFPTLSWRLYQAVDHMQHGIAALIGCALLLLSLPIMILAQWAQKNNHALFHLRNITLSTLSKKLAVLHYCVYGAFLFLGLIVPVIGIISWCTSTYDAQALGNAMESLGHSCLLAAIGTVCIIILTWLPAWYHAQHTSPTDRFMESAILLGNALPGTLIAGGTLLAGLAFSRFFDSQTAYAFLGSSGCLLFIAYAIHFIPESYTPIVSTLRRFDHRQDDVAQSLGCGYWKRFFQLRLSQARPGLSVAIFLSMIAIIKELPMTLLLGNSMGLHPLSYRLWDRLNDSFLFEAGILSIVLLLITTLGLLISLRWRKHV